MPLKRSKLVNSALGLFERLFYASGHYIRTQSSLINLYNLYQVNISHEVAPGSLVQYLQQVKINFENITRVGSEIDGGYVMIRPLFGRTAISVGIGGDVSWDLAMAQQGSRVYMFDHTVKRPPKKVPNSKFFKIGITGNQKANLKSLLSLNEILVFLNLTSANNMYLKIDVEGAEWDVLKTVTLETLNKFDQILIEFHDLHLYKNELDVFKKLITNHAIIHINPNNYSSFFFDNNFLIPNILEVTFVKKSVLSSFHSKNYSKFTFKNDSRVPALSNKVFRLSQ